MTCTNFSQMTSHTRKNQMTTFRSECPVINYGRERKVGVYVYSDDSNGVWHIYRNEHGYHSLIQARTWEDAYDCICDLLPAIDDNEVKDAYGLDDEDDLDYQNLPELAEGYRYQSNSTGNGIVWTGYNDRLDIADLDEVCLDYELILHGVVASDYFQGCGVSFSRFDMVVTGCGCDLEDALNDAIEMMSQQECFDGDKSQLIPLYESLIRHELRQLGFTGPLSSYDNVENTRPPENENTDYDDDGLYIDTYCFVSIRFNYPKF